MSMAQPFLIAPLRIGLERDIEPWLLPNDAFPTLEDAYMFRGRVKRRRGFNLLGRLQVAITTPVILSTQANGAAYAKADLLNDSAIGVRAIAPNAEIIPATLNITVGAVTFVDNGQGVLVGTPGTNSGTINYITGAMTLSFNPALGGATNVSVTFTYYPDLPVMGLRTLEITTINKEQLFAFDMIKSYLFNTSNGLFEDKSQYQTTSTEFSWTGSNKDFFYTVNYLNAFWATNGTKGFQNVVDATTPGGGDGIRWYGTTAGGTGWSNFLPNLNNAHTSKLMGALLLIPYRNRLVALNTIEGTAIGTSTTFRQRARWCQNGTPFQTTAVPVGLTGDDDAWNSEMIGKGDYFDAPTQEAIVGAEFYKDTLVVFFERSTWQLRYSGNETLPFIWERINVELGGESTFSVVPFDSGILAVGNYGIVSCDATGVKRIDQIIPDEVFNIHNGNDGPKRVHGTRDYPQQLVYWAFPSEEQDPTFPNRVLVYNYLDGSYSFFNDSFTCFGQYQPFNDTKWQDLDIPWEQYPYAWDDGSLQSDYPQICAGNQQGFVFNRINGGPIINEQSLAITGATKANPCVITCVNHNLLEGTIIKIEDASGMIQLNGNIYRVSKPITSNTFIIQTLDPSGAWINVDSTAFGTYIVGGSIIVRNNFNITTKRFNPFIQGGEQLRLQSVDLFMENSETTEFTMNIYLDENDNDIFQIAAVAPDSPQGGKVWIASYVSVIGQFAQLEFKFDDAQMVDPTSSDGDVVLHAMMLWMSKGGRLIYGMTT